MFEKQPWMQRAGEYPRSDQDYFALLSRAVFSAGLGPKVVESRWKEMSLAFHDFDPAKVQQMGEEHVARLLSDPGVIRNRRKIEAVIKNAGTFLEQIERRGANRGTSRAGGGRAGGSQAADGQRAAGRAAASRAAASREAEPGPADDPASAGQPAFHSYLLELGADSDLDAAADSLAQVFAHLGRTSAVFFLFSAGWRPRETGAEGLPLVSNG
jgi:hypothetical protein